MTHIDGSHTIATKPIARTVAAVVADAEQRLRAISGDDGRIEAQVLLAHALGIGRSQLLARLSDDVDGGTAATFERLLARRLAREPLAYIVGRREFYGIDIACAPGALIPRPETEMLVEIALAEARRRGSATRVADVGTGSGAIAVAIAANAPNARVVAADASNAALAIARGNIERISVGDRIELRRTHLLDACGVFDVIVANLPYVSESDWRELPPELRDHEPREALVGGDRGTEIIEALLASTGAHLTHDGVMALEVGAMQGAEMSAAARRLFPNADVRVETDLAGLDRVVVVRNKEGSVAEETETVPTESLQAAVEAQAKARVAGDLATFASYVMPQALVSLHRISHGPRASERASAFTIIDVTEDGDRGVSVVVYRGGGSYEVRSVWERIDEHWKVVDASIPRGSVRAPWWKRMLGMGGGDAANDAAARRDLQ